MDIISRINKKRYFFGVVGLFLFFLFLVSCSHKAGSVLSVIPWGHKPDPKPTWSFGKRGIIINYKADKQINMFDNRPHTLLLVVYQLKDINNFIELAKYEDGLKQLLEVRGDDPTVMASDKIFIEPGSSDTIVLDRAEKARWVGIVAGYYQLDPQKVSRIFKIPFRIETKGLIMRKRIAKIERLKINLILGKSGIQVLKEKRKR